MDKLLALPVDLEIRGVPYSYRKAKGLLVLSSAQVVWFFFFYLIIYDGDV